MLTLVVPLASIAAATSLGAVAFLIRQAVEDSTGPTAAENEKAITASFERARKTIAAADPQRAITGPRNKPLWPDLAWAPTSAEDAQQMLHAATKEIHNRAASENRSHPSPTT
ncbi:hypothetical protein [Streptosporangium roseum]|uniref:hypothetical protein n=1 Tax=Streptosporangium roseum TaxID=2001 RepID=UPI00332E8493